MIQGSGPALAEQAAAPPPSASLAWRVGSVFAAPRRLARQLRAEPEWLGPLLISILVGVVVIVLLPDSVFYEAMQNATTRRGEAVTITSEPEIVALWERVRLSLGVVVTQPLKAAIIAGLLSFVFTRLLRGTARFRHYLALTTHGLLISALGALLSLPLQIATADADRRVWTTVLSELAPADPTLQALVSAVDPFTLWMLGFLVVGIPTVNQTRRTGVSALVLFGAYGLFVLVAVVAGVRSA